MTSIPISMLRDDFSDGAFALAWGASATLGSATFTEAAGRATITLPSSVAGSHEAAFATGAVYNLTGDGCTINIQTMVATGVAATAYFDLRLDNNNYLRWRQVSNVITARSMVAAVDTQLFTATWSATTYQYLRIRESGGTIFFDSSTNGTTWTNRASVANPFAVTSLAVWLGALCGTVASPGTFKIEDVNLILPALTTNWHWTQTEWPLFNRYRNITIAATSGQGYLATASSVDASGNLVSPQYWSGPLAGDAETLTSQATQTAAQAMAVNLPLDGRWGLPQMVEARYVRLYHRSITGSSYTLREDYPRRLLQADDVEAEVFRGLRYEGHQFICDQLSALSANVGVLTAGVIDGVTIYAGGQKIRLDATGLQINTHLTSVFDSARAISFTDSTRKVSLIESYTDGIFDDIRIGVYKAGTFMNLGSRMIIADDITATNGSSITLSLLNAPGAFNFRNGGLNIGTTAAGAADGQIASTGVSALGGATLDANIALGVKGPGTTTATRGLRVTNAAAAISLDVYDDRTVAIPGGLNVGTAVGAVAGQIKISGAILVGTTIQTSQNIPWSFGGVTAGNPGTPTKYATVVISGVTCKVPLL